MKFLSFTILFFFVLCSACATAPPPRTVHIIPQVKMQIYADTSFTDSERIAINEAVQNLYEQTSSFVDIKISYELDFHSMDSLREHSRHNILVRVDSSAKDLGNDTIGYCIVNFRDLDFSNPTKIALVHDRLPLREAWIHVAMHEILHAIRLQHIPEDRTIMYRTTPVAGNGIITCLTSYDMRELCEVHGCDLRAMKPCRN